MPALMSSASCITTSSTCPPAPICLPLCSTATPAPAHMQLTTIRTAWCCLLARLSCSSSSVLAPCPPSPCEEWGSDTVTAPTYNHHVHIPGIKAGDIMPSNKRLTSIKLLWRKKSTISTLEACSKLVLRPLLVFQPSPLRGILRGSSQCWQRLVIVKLGFI